MLSWMKRNYWAPNDVHWPYLWDITYLKWLPCIECTGVKCVDIPSSLSKQRGVTQGYKSILTWGVSGSDGEYVDCEILLDVDIITL